MYAIISLLATYVVFIPIVITGPEYPQAQMVVETYEQEADILLGREANNLKLDVASDAMQLSGCFAGELCEEGSPFIGPEDHMSRWCMITEVDVSGWIIMKCAYPYPEWGRGVYDMNPRLQVFEDGSFILYATMPFEIDPQ